MKKLIAIILILTLTSCGINSKAQNSDHFRLPKNQIDSLNKLKVNDDFKQTAYSVGFTYYNEQGLKTTLIKWVKTGTWLGVDMYRWRIKIEFGSQNILAWTDDCWIDVATGKAYLNTQLHKIIYYDKY